MKRYPAAYCPNNDGRYTEPHDTLPFPRYWLDMFQELKCCSGTKGWNNERCHQNPQVPFEVGSLYNIFHDERGKRRKKNGCCLWEGISASDCWFAIWFFRNNQSRNSCRKETSYFFWSWGIGHFFWIWMRGPWHSTSPLSLGSIWISTAARRKRTLAYVNSSRPSRNQYREAVISKLITKWSLLSSESNNMMMMMIASSSSCLVDTVETTEHFIINFCAEHDDDGEYKHDRPHV